ncbi:WSC domain protein [Metarhizium anisopliae]
MKAALILQVTALVAGTRLPQLQWDPDTVPDCIEWENNIGENTCEYIRDFYTITPEQFSKWNPSVGLDCKPWNIQSYCIVTQERMDEFKRTHTTSPTSTTTATSTSTTSTSTLGPSPTTWTALGCYKEGTPPILKTRMSPEGGEEALTIPKCQDICYRASFRFAGVMHGIECWCSPYVGGEWAKDAAECNLPCTGDAKAICGGKNRLNVFRAEESKRAPSSTSKLMQSSLTAKELLAIPETTQFTSGATRNFGLL